MICICLFGLLYQVSLLLDDYLKGKTVVSLNVGLIQFDTLPAFTICTRDLLAITKVVNYDKRFVPQLEEYKKLYNDLAQLPKDASSKANETKILGIMDNIFDHFKNKIDFLHIPGIDVHDNLTVQLKPSGIPYAYFNVFIVGLMAVNGSNIEVNSTVSTELMANQQLFPIESLKVSYFGGYDAQKCFTSFSYLKPIWRTFQFKLDSLEIHLQPKFDWMPSQKFREIMFSIHSPNTLPDVSWENYNVLPMGKIHDMMFNQIHTELLGDGYDTNCFNYDLDYKYANFNMRSDCILDCFHESLRRRCNFTDFPQFDKLLRGELLRANSKLVINDNKCGSGLKTRAECFNECRPDCKYKYYLWERKERVRTDDREKTLIITLRHSRMPDVSIRHTPQISLISFVCNFGGLLGMWLGLSILSIFDQSIPFVRKIFCKGNLYLGKVKNVKNDFTINLKQIDKFERAKNLKNAWQDKYNQCSIIN